MAPLPFASRAFRLKTLQMFLFGFIAFSVLPAQAYNILYYYNGPDPVGGCLLKGADFLTEGHNHVTVIDVKGAPYDPTPDNWSQYDQVWDARMAKAPPGYCGNGSEKSPDYFTAFWEKNAVSYLNHCGKLFLLLEDGRVVNEEYRAMRLMFRWNNNI